MELTELQFITTETKKFLKQYNLSQVRNSSQVQMFDIIVDEERGRSYILICHFPRILRLNET